MSNQAGLTDVSKVINKLLCILFIYLFLGTHTNLDQQEIIEKYGKDKYLRFQTSLDVKDFKNLEIDNCEPSTLKKYVERANKTADLFFLPEYGPY